MSPPEAPLPSTAFGWPRYSACPHADAPAPPRPPRLRHRSLPPPSPRSEPRKTSLSRLTWMAGSPSVFVPHPVAPTVAAWGWPVEKVAATAAALRAGRLDFAATAAGAKASSAHALSPAVHLKGCFIGSPLVVCGSPPRLQRARPANLALRVRLGP